ncbi:hypothetical protein BMW23_0256 [Bodo saltans virus]|uniref:Transmembrane protein n=1 Tax=Bodo saltans virus TaxID=2024608 RepID=A0A2H4UTW7_9VIRU|nr:hypothetical protein QJ851_gp0251 [Bodo saltans virus]ATZ80314.1 hypothetical protein BMW23_0256 [Bodo saltans virus]
MSSNNQVNPQNPDNEQKQSSCSLTNSGITVMGVFVPWILVVVVALVIAYFLYKRGMFGEDVNTVIAPPSVPAGIPSAAIMSNASPILPQGDVSKFFNHNKW